MSQYRSTLTPEQLRDSLVQYRLARLQEKIAADLRAAEAGVSTVLGRQVFPTHLTVKSGTGADRAENKSVFG